ncbi:MAG: hypothetical protein AAGA03_16970, partial [Planctomycetota bacterium]
MLGGHHSVLTLALGVLLQTQISVAAADDPISIWNQLSPAQQAEVEKTLTKRLPQVLPESEDYAKRLAAEIPRWITLTRDLEGGDYMGVVGAFQSELTDFVTDQIDQSLPEDGFARWVFDQASEHRDSLHAVALDLANPDKNWADVRQTLFAEAAGKATARSEEVLENCVVHVIDDVIGVPDASIAGYSPGELYVLAVLEWKDFVASWPEYFESEATNQLFELYLVHRIQYGKADAESAVAFQLLTERVTTGERTGRMIRSWSARLAPLSQRLGLTPQQLSDKLLVLCDQYWNTAGGQAEQRVWRNLADRYQPGDIRTQFHSWMSRRIQDKVHDGHLIHRRQAAEQIATGRVRVRSKLQKMHQRIARELLDAIEAALNDEQREARDEAIARARELLELIRTRYVPLSRQHCRTFGELANQFEAIDDRARAANALLFDGVSDEITQLQADLESIQALVAECEAKLAIVHGRFDESRAAVARAEAVAQTVCRYANQVVSAESKDQAYGHLIDASKESVSATRLIERARTLAVQTSLMQKTLQRQLRSPRFTGFDDELQTVREGMREIEAALATVQRKEQLRSVWTELRGKLRQSASEQVIVRRDFDQLRGQIKTLIAPHQVNAQITVIRTDLTRFGKQLDCLEPNLQRWQRWQSAYFPTLRGPTS